MSEDTPDTSESPAASEAAGTPEAADAPEVEKSDEETIEQIKSAVTSFQEQLPATANLKLVFAFELEERDGDIPLYRVELPGPEVIRHPAGDARVTVMMDRGIFDHMLQDGSLARYRRAYATGRIKTGGSRKILKLLLMAIEQQEEANKAVGK